MANFAKNKFTIGLLYLFVAALLSWPICMISCSIPATGTNCDITKCPCPTGAIPSLYKEAIGQCNTEGQFIPIGQVSVGGSCVEEGKCSFVCSYPPCAAPCSLIITKDTWSCNCSLCAGIACDGHGKCVLNNDQPTCQCDPGYESSGVHCLVVENCVISSLTYPKYTRQYQYNCHICDPTLNKSGWSVVTDSSACLDYNASGVCLGGVCSPPEQENVCHGIVCSNGYCVSVPIDGGFSASCVCNVGFIQMSIDNPSCQPLPGCYIDEIYVVKYETAPGGACRICDPVLNYTDWTNIPNGTECWLDDRQGYCVNGECVIE